MMTVEQCLLVCVMEECAEVAHRASKALRFGMDEVQPGQPLTNEDRLWGEVNDLIGVLILLQEKRDHPGPSDHAVQQKRGKVERFMAYSVECGQVAP